MHTSTPRGDDAVLWAVPSDRELLRRCTVIADLSEQGLQWFETVAQRSRYTRGELISGPTDGEGGVFAIARGGARVYLLASDSRELTVFYRYSGEIFELGQTEASSAGERVAEAVVDDTVIYSATWSRFLDIVAPGPAGALVGTLREAMGESYRVIQEVAFFTIKARVAHKLVELTESTPNGVVRNTRAELATMVGTRPEEVMKALRQLRDEGFIYYRPHSREILVLQPGWLAMF